MPELMLPLNTPSESDPSTNGPTVNGGGVSTSDLKVQFVMSVGSVQVSTSESNDPVILQTPGSSMRISYGVAAERGRHAGEKSKKEDGGET